jgi:exodeoxyribonuclease VII large subunit
MPLVRLIAELGRRIGEIGVVIVEGEVHEAKQVGSGRWFFTIKDRAVQMPATVAPGVRRARIVNGERVAVTGQVVADPGRGQIRLVASEVVPIGDGAIAALIAQTRDRLRSEGLIDRPRRPLPMVPRGIVVVCGADAAVKHDIQSVASTRFPGFPLHFIEVLMSAPDAIVSGIEQASRFADADVVIVARGGGDATQLLPFSDEWVCRAVAACRHVVISAIGHQINSPLCDEVADHRAGTPSIAAAMAVPDRSAIVSRLDHGLRAAAVVAQRRVDRAQLQLSVVGDAWERAPETLLARAEHRLGSAEFRAVVERTHGRAALRLDSIEWRHRTPALFARSSLQLDGAWGVVGALAPARVLERGYAIARDATGSVIRDPSTLRTGDAIVVTVLAGSVDATVQAVHPENDDRDHDDDQPDTSNT